MNVNNMPDYNEERDIYSEEGREDLVEDDAIEPWEEGFMRGAAGLGQEAKCRNCGDILTRNDSVVESEIEGELMKFCSEDCAKEYQEKLHH